jgi:serine/threonine protein kinase
MPVLVASQSELIPGYRLIERLRQGGLGEVWKAEAPDGLLKAIKIINGSLSSTGDAAHLHQELKDLHRVKTVRHPYILALDSVEIVEGRLVIVSEWADRTLLDRFRECRAQGLPGIPRQELLRYMEEAAEALDLMNGEFNLQHLDIKPQNLFLVYNHVKVGDFGLVKDLEGMFAKITSGVTTVYAAPETFDGTVSRFCDQYNLAMAYQELLTGRLPYDGTTVRQLMLQHLTGIPRLEPLPGADQPVVGRALSKKPEERYPSCLDFVHALQQADQQSNETAPKDLVAGHSAVNPTPVQVPDTTTLMVQGAAQLPGEGEGEGEDGPATPGLDKVPNLTPDPADTSKPTEERPAYVNYEPPPPPPERPETTGEGVLLPALVIGLGGLGRGVLQKFRKSLRKRDPNQTWPHIRLLSVDTDPGGFETSTNTPDALLTPGEFLVTPFQRPSHYLKRQREREQLEAWLPLAKLTSVPRGQTSAGGWRALGRLAFVSCAATVAKRLRDELEACSAEPKLQEVARRTNLGLRSSRPRVYVVTSLCGGTGSGMFLDLASTLRRELQQIGHPRAEVIGVFLVPAVEGTGAARGVANAYAALSELSYFARSAAAEAASKDGPHKLAFDRCVVLPLPLLSDRPALDEFTTLAGDFLCRELTSTLGRGADEERAALKHESAPGSAPGMICQTFGAYWFSVPRRPLLHHVARHICDRLARSWHVHDRQGLGQATITWLTDQMNRAGLSTDLLLGSLHEASAASLGQTASDYFNAWLARYSKGGPADLRRSPGALGTALGELELMLGPVHEDPTLNLDSRAAKALSRACSVVAQKAEAGLGEISLNILAEPLFRFACNEEAVLTQLGLALGHAARHCKTDSEQKCRLAQDILGKIPALRKNLQSGWLFFGMRARKRAAASALDLLAKYLAMRWDGMVHLALSRLCQDLQMNLRKYSRGVECCHKRIDQFLKTFAAAADETRSDLGLGRYLLPLGSRTLEDAVKRILDSLPPAEESALHEAVRQLTRTTFRDNVHVCTAPMSLLRGLREQIDREVEKVAQTSLGRAHAAEVYLEQHADDSAADDDLLGAFDEAQPELASSSGQGFCILAVPPGPEGERFRALVRHALPDVPMQAVTSIDDIIFYREQPHLCLTDLPQQGRTAREIYQRVLATEPYSPHCRTDITSW